MVEMSESNQAHRNEGFYKGQQLNLALWIFY